LREAAQSGNITRLNALLAERIDIDARDANGRSALMLAVLHDQQQAVNSLLAAGADPNAADSTGTRPLQAAIVGARPEIVAALRRAGAR
jgi:ankyrin repeat protein